jgi:hypothetical protein
MVGGLIMDMDQRTESEKDRLRPDTIIVTGSARLPENITAKHVFGYFAIELEIDPVDCKIIDVSCTMIPSLGEKIVYNAKISWP